MFAFPCEAIESLTFGCRTPKAKQDEIVDLIRATQECFHIKLFKARCAAAIETPSCATYSVACSEAPAHRLVVAVRGYDLSVMW